MPGDIKNQSPVFLDRWQNPGDHASYARYTMNPDETDQFFSQSDATYEDATHIRLQDINLTYRLTPKLLKKAGIGIQGARIILNAQNVFVISRYSGFDPRVSSFGALPVSRFFSGRLQLDF